MYQPLSSGADQDSCHYPQTSCQNHTNNAPIVFRELIKTCVNTHNHHARKKETMHQLPLSGADQDLCHYQKTFSQKQTIYLELLKISAITHKHLTRNKQCANHFYLELIKTCVNTCKHLVRSKQCANHFYLEMIKTCVNTRKHHARSKQ